MARPKGKRKQQKVTYILGEGITEYHYFKHLKRIKGYRFEVKPRFFKATSLKEMEERIPDLLKDKATVICVFDADTSERNAAENERLERIKREYGKNKSVLLCDSLQAIEYWFILHYEDCCPAHLNEISDYVFSLHPKTNDEDEWVDSFTICHFLKISDRTLQRLRTKGLVSYTNLGGKYYYQISEVKRMMRDKLIKSTDERLKELISSHKDYLPER